MILMVKFKKKAGGFTLVEIVLALFLFGVVASIAMNLFIEVSIANQRVVLQRELMEDSRFTLERVVGEIRKGTVDYAEYWNWMKKGEGDLSVSCKENLNGNFDGGDEVFEEYEDEEYGNYGACYQFYAASFYDGERFFAPGDVRTEEKIAKEHLGKNEDGLNAIDEELEEELYLINAAGTRKTILRRRVYGDDITEETLCTEDGIFDQNNPNTRDNFCRLEMMEMVGSDSDADGKVDTWECEGDYLDDGGACRFIPISSPNVHVVDLKFKIAPVEDPYKAYREAGVEKMQPRVMIFLTTEVIPERAAYLPGLADRIELQTMVTARVYNEVTLYENY